MAKNLPINPKIVQQLAKATVKNIVDGIVELVTNSDDSYKRLEEKGLPVNGKISIYVNRKKGGICERLVVKDFGEGMTKEKLEKAIEYAGETSGFEEGRSVRGFFGRGLKETIVALGEGAIRTAKDGVLCGTRIWTDKRTQIPKYDDIMLDNTVQTSEGNGTEVDIQITNKDVKIPQRNNCLEKIRDHYALRDINSSENRQVEVTFEELIGKKIKQTSQVRFSYPQGKTVMNERRILPEYGDEIQIKIVETSEPLSSPRLNPFGRAGILIKTNSSILDNSLFKFENEPAALYFHGEAKCVEMEQRLRSGETNILDPNRCGLEWRHEYCQALSHVIEDTLEPFVLEKKRALGKKSGKEIRQSTKKMLNKLRSLLNELAKKEMEDIEDITTDPEPDITHLIIKPEIVNIYLDRPRTLSIYAPFSLVIDEGTVVRLESGNPVEIRLLATTVKLEKHPVYFTKLWYRYFKVVGLTMGAEATITARLGNEIAHTKVKVIPPVEPPPPIQIKKKRIAGRKGGFISDIVSDNLHNPGQRVIYSDGIVTIYTEFPSVAKFIGNGLDRVETPEGRLLLAELVGEAFCRQLAIRGIELGKYLKIPGNEIDSFNVAVNELQKRYLHRIQEIIFNWQF